MEERENTPLESLLEKGENYTITTFELLKLKTLDKTAGLLSSLFFNVIVIIVISLFFMLVTFGLALWLSDLLGKSWYGFFSVAGFYGITGTILYLFMGNWVKKKTGDFIIKHSLK